MNNITLKSQYSLLKPTFNLLIYIRKIERQLLILPRLLTFKTRSKNLLLTIIVSFFCINSFAQSFAPAAGQPGSTAIEKDSSIIVSWATGVTIQRGYLDIANPTQGFASYGTDEDALFEAEGDATSVVSLGDSGVAILTFDVPLMNGFGPDFAVFENGFADDFLELGFVEVSSDGTHFVRFPAISETPVVTQIGPFEFSDCRYVHNLAGKYRAGFGTPFDLEDLVDSIGIDLNAIRYIKIIDVVGSINSTFGSYDGEGTIINDLYPTAFPSGGFDLDAVAVINEAPPVKLDDNFFRYSIYPNPTNNWLTIETEAEHSLLIFDATGRILEQFPNAKKRILSIKKYASQIVFIKVQVNDVIITERIICY